ncbi:Hpt domain-containing protein [Bdellovibrio sp. HCB274]|uniref:Hpt domain-containing protein n=1 Tax=Bdellovibrio sp. HCB274 TaxID=3394361 RepID=UPI0039B38FE6
MDDDFKVSVESQVRYLNRRIVELGAVITGETVDFELAKKMGHQIKGNAENFEFENLIDMAKELEFSAIEADKVAVQSAVQSLLDALNVHLKNLAP